MIMPSDEDYQRAKKRKIRGGVSPSPFNELMSWVATTFGVYVIDVEYDTVIPDNRPRLQVIVDRRRDEQTFRDGFNYDAVKQRQVAQKFVSLLADHHLTRFRTDGLFVVFSAFESVARIEANHGVTQADLDQLMRRLDNPDLWRFHPLFDAVTIFFYTDAQVRAAEANGLQQRYAVEYARVVAPYDEFGYLAESPIDVRFDSKQNFDTNYHGNWFFYDR